MVDKSPNETKQQSSLNKIASELNTSRENISGHKQEIELKTPVLDTDAPSNEKTYQIFQKDNPGYLFVSQTVDLNEAKVAAQDLHSSGRDVLVNEKGNQNMVHARSNIHYDPAIGPSINFEKPVEVPSKFYMTQPLDFDPKHLDAAINQELKQQDTIRSQIASQQDKIKDAIIPLRAYDKDSVAVQSLFQSVGTAEKNSIEFTNTPERSDLKPSFVDLKNETRQGIASPVLMVFTKEGNGYALQHETKNFQEAMKQAERYYEKGEKDILVNEKDNPLIIYAKSNRDKDVDVGREIWPQKTPQGADVKGPGEVVLSSFFAKLPMDTKTIDERAAVLPVKEPTKDVGDPVGHNTPKTPEAAADEPAKTKAIPEAPEVGTGPKAILNKTGYELPEKLLGTYSVQDGKFHDKDTNALRFEDHGKKLSTPVEDRQVIAHMVDVAVAKNWGGPLELKGTETFKQGAWLEIESRGIETKGYKPSERDLEQLEKLRQERGTNEKQMGGPDTKPVREQNEIAAAAPRTLSPQEKMSLDVATRVMEKAMAKLPEHIRVDALAKMTKAVEKGELKLPTPKVMERAIDKPRPAPVPAMDRNR